MTHTFDLELLDRTFYLDETSETGMRWKVFNRAIKDASKRFPGDIAGFKKAITGGGHDYYRVKLQGTNYAVHRIVWALHNNMDIPEGYVINHKDCNTFNNRIENLEICLQKENMRRRKDHADLGVSKANTSGKTGVVIDTKVDKLRGTESVYYKAVWSDIDGKQRSKSFSVKKLGEELAEFLASEYRRHQIDLLNLQGAGYTDRHGI
jgi:hypothetical protein